MEAFLLKIRNLVVNNLKKFSALLTGVSLIIGAWAEYSGGVIESIGDFIGKLLSGT
jgi:hypothetical protein